MRVIYFHQHFTTPKIGGGTRSYEFAQKLIQRGHQVTMVSGGDKSAFNLPATGKKNIYRGVVDGIDVIQIHVPYSNNDGKMARAKAFLRYATKSIHYAMHEDYDLIFCTTTPLTSGIPGLFAKWFRRKKFVFEVRDFWPDSTKTLFAAVGKKYPWYLDWGLSFLGNRCYRAADACIGLAPGICDAIKSHSQKGKRVELIPNGCDLDLFSPEKRGKLELAGVNEGDTVAVFTGAHGVANGLGAVLDAAAVLKQKGRNDIKMVFVGNGMMKQALVERAEKEGLDNCLFFKPVPKTELTKIVCSADIGMQILTNATFFYYGTSPNKFFDFISSGLPVINNYPGWIADMINENKCGVAVEPLNAEAFADGLIYLTDHPEERKQMGANARKLAERDFNRENLSTQFVDYLESVING